MAVVTQKAMLTATSRVDRWLDRLAVREVLLYCLKRGRQAKLIGHYAGRIASTGEPGRGPCPLGWLLAEEVGELVRRAIAAMPRLKALEGQMGAIKRLIEELNEANRPEK